MYLRDISNTLKVLMDFMKYVFSKEETSSGSFASLMKANLFLLANGYQKKTQRTPKSEIEKALKIKKQYEQEK